MKTNRRPHRRYLRNFIINGKLQLNLIVPAVILSATMTATLDVLYYFIFNNFLRGPDTPEGLNFGDSGILVHMVSVSIVITLISIAAISAALVVQTHQILGPLVPVARHVRRLIEGKYDEELVIRKDDKLHELVKDLNELTKQLGSKKKA